MPRATLEAETKRQVYNRNLHSQALAEIRDIGEIPPPLDSRLRAQMRYNLKQFLEQVYPSIFYMGWSDDQVTLVEELEYRILHGGLKAVAMPRGGGKSSIVFGTIQWCIAYGHRKFPFVIKADQESADKFVDGIRRDWETNPLLGDMYPEIAIPIRALEGSATKARMQTYQGERTYLEWKKDHINFPCLFDYDYDLDHQAGIVIGCRGITGSFRGTNHLHPMTGEMVRPDFVILDDVQTDKTATSPTGVQKMVDLIDGAVKGLSPPGELIAGVMPCTVIAPNDVSDKYLSKDIKPEWSGMRCSMVTSWPNGITDEVITDETRPSRLWQEYANLRVQSLREYGDIHLATEFYERNREVMDKGFEVSWEERYNKDETYEGNVEISAQQHAMNLRLENIFTFSAEYQNNPRTILANLAEVPTVDQILDRTIAYNPRELPHYVNKLVGFIDVQDEALIYGVVGLSMEYSGVITDIGTFPEFPEVNINKVQMAKQRKLSREFFNAHSSNGSEFSRLETKWLEKTKETQATLDGKLLKRPKAPFEAKITWALRELFKILLEPGRYTIKGSDTPLVMDYLGVDCHWGQASDTVKRCICEVGDPRIVPYDGIYVGATSRKMEEYRRGDGAIFEDEVHADLGCCRWVARYDKTTRSRRLLSDVNAWKSFLVLNRLTAPMGSPGAIALFNAKHKESLRQPLLAQHLVRSEAPEKVTARERTIYEWKVTGNNIDNEWLDIFTGCMALASVAGCRIDDMPLDSITAPKKDPEPQRGRESHASPSTVKKRIKLSELAAAKQATRQSSGIITSYTDL